MSAEHRDEDAPLTEGEVRSLAVEIVDTIHGFTWEFSASPGAHKTYYDETEAILRRALTQRPPAVADEAKERLAGLLDDEGYGAWVDTEQLVETLREHSDLARAALWRPITDPTANRHGQAHLSRAERDSSPPRDDQRDGSKSAEFGRDAAASSERRA